MKWSLKTLHILVSKLTLFSVCLHFVARKNVNRNID